MVLNLPLISNSSNHLSMSLETGPWKWTIIGISVMFHSFFNSLQFHNRTFMFHSFFHSLAWSRYLPFFSLSFRFILWSAGTTKSTILQILFFFLLIIIRSGLLAGIRWSVCMLKSHWSLYVAFSRIGVGLCIFHLLVWSNFNFLHISQWITLPTQSCLALYSLCANLLHPLIM